MAMVLSQWKRNSAECGEAILFHENVMLQDMRVLLYLRNATPRHSHCEVTLVKTSETAQPGQGVKGRRVAYFVPGNNEKRLHELAIQ